MPEASGGVGPAGARPGLRRASAGSSSRISCRSPSALATSLASSGPNGAGKTSLFALISGDLAPASGEIRFGGQPGRPGWTRRPGAGSAIGRTYQVPRPFGEMTVFENVLVAVQQGARLRRQASYDRAARRPGADRAGAARPTSPPSGSGCCSASGWRWPGHWPPARG